MLKKKPLQAFSMAALCLLAGVAQAGCGAGGGASSPSAGTSGSGGPGSLSYSQEAQAGVAALQGWYLQSSGQYASPSGWWNAANSMTVLANYARATGDASYNSALANTFLQAQNTHSNFENSYYDDTGWWALAWIDAYDLTGNTQYLQMAETMFKYEIGGWQTGECGGGGMNWSTTTTYQNAITNELFLAFAAKLANRTTGAASANYLIWANKEWMWLKASGMINSKGLINDGLNAYNAASNPCANNNKTTWTYNQGVILGGLVELSKANNDPALLTEAETIASAAIANLSVNGILTESGALSGGDGPQFKGVFMRNLMALYQAIPSTSPQAAQYKAYAQANANSIWASDWTAGNKLGGSWQGPFDSGDATRQTSALDAVIAADAMK